MTMELLSPFVDSQSLQDVMNSINNQTNSTSVYANSTVNSSTTPSPVIINSQNQTLANSQNVSQTTTSNLTQNTTPQVQNTTISSSILPSTFSQPSQLFNILQAYSNPSQLPSININQLYSKWIIQQITNQDGSLGNPSDYSSYYILITAARILIYGDCNVYFTSYILTGNTLSNIQVKSTTLTCPAAPLTGQNSMANLRNWEYVTIENNVLRVWDQDMIEIMQLITA